MTNLGKLGVLTLLMVGFGIVGSDRTGGDAQPALPSTWAVPNLTADGGAPPAPPIPIPKDFLTADGGAPPAPPIPLPKGETTLVADGGAPPAPPIPLVSA